MVPDFSDTCSLSRGKAPQDTVHSDPVGTAGAVPRRCQESGMCHEPVRCQESVRCQEPVWVWGTGENGDLEENLTRTFWHERSAPMISWLSVLA
jgi:hypothetical protein